MKILTVVVVALLVSKNSYGQGTTFQNLDFEQANPIPGGPPFTVTASSAFPDWTIYCGTVQQTSVYQNEYAFNQATADIFGPGYPAAGSEASGTPGIIDGSYTAVIQGGVQNINPFTFVSTSLEQTGTIPLGDDSLLFKAWVGASTSFSVSFNGNNLSLFNLGSGPNYTLYGADITEYSGQTGLLAFTANAQTAQSLLELDDITFSTTVVPEPSPIILTGIVGIAYTLRRCFWRKRK